MSVYVVLRDEARRVFREHPEASGLVAGLAWAAVLAAKHEGVAIIRPRPAPARGGALRELHAAPARARLRLLPHLRGLTVFDRCAGCKKGAYGVYRFPGSSILWPLCGTCRERYAKTAARVV